MYCSLLRIQFTSSAQIKPSHIAFGRTIDIIYLLTYLLVLYQLLSSEPAPGTLALFNSNKLMMLWWLMKGCMGQRFATSVMLLFGLQNLCMCKKVGR